MGAADARHLLGRAGFAGTLAEIEHFAALPRTEAVRALVAGIRADTLLPPPAFLSVPRAERRIERGQDEEARKEILRRRREEGLALKSWWIAECALTDSPLTERLVLFWHDHFTTELRKVNDAEFLWRQNALLREHAGGNFREMLQAICLDAAMVIYLDTQQNNRASPNENFARELLELFTLGEGHYGEEDIREAARAFTGWKVDRVTGDVRLLPRQHDSGTKTFRGRSGPLEVHDIVRILCEEPRTAELVVEELWREWISPVPAAEEVRRLAAIFREGGLALRPLYEAMLLSPAYWAAKNRGALIRSPVELVVGTARILGLEDVPPQSLHRSAAAMGQDLFDPPNVKGWPGGERWITSSSLLTRRRFLERASTGLAPAAGDRDRRGGGFATPPSGEPAAMDPAAEPPMAPSEDPPMGERGEASAVPGPGDEPRAARPLVRRRLLERRGAIPAMAMLSEAWRGLGTDDAARAEALAVRLCALPPVVPRPEGERAAETLSRLLLDPTYQLK